MRAVRFWRLVVSIGLTVLASTGGVPYGLRYLRMIRPRLDASEPCPPPRRVRTMDISMLKLSVPDRQIVTRLWPV